MADLNKKKKKNDKVINVPHYQNPTMSPIIKQEFYGRCKHLLQGNQYYSALQTDDKKKLSHPLSLACKEINTVNV